MTNYVRSLVSKKKRRYNLDGFDLDLTYISDKIIAMGFPSEKLEGIYRNKLTDVVRFLETRHPGRYKVYNLCSERSYSPSKFNGRVSVYPFDDHNPPPIEIMKPFCVDVFQWLKKDEKNVAVVHCKAGKGRTGVMICAYLLHSGKFDTAQEALDYYGAARTKNGKGVTIPSQIRYVNYYAQLLNTTYQPKTLLLSTFKMHSTPQIKDNAISTFFIVRIKNTKVFKSKPVEIRKNQIETMLFEGSIPLCGDIKIELYQKDFLSHKKLGHFWFNTFFVSNNLYLQKSEIDKCNKDKSHKAFSSDFGLELDFVDPVDSLKIPQLTLQDDDSEYEDESQYS